MAELHW